MRSERPSAEPGVAPAVEPAHPGLEDPVAQSTDWTPLQSGGASFRTHRLTQVAPHRMQFRAELGARAFCLAFFGLGTAAVLFCLFAIPEKDAGSIGRYVGVLVGSLFVAIGAGLYYDLSRPVVLDKRFGFFWRGWRAPTRGSRPVARSAVPLEQIHALQLLGEVITGSDSSYSSYELNLVLKDGRRTGVVDHGDAARLRADAQALAAFLGVPVWDAADRPVYEQTKARPAGSRRASHSGSSVEVQGTRLPGRTPKQKLAAGAVVLFVGLTVGVQTRVSFCAQCGLLRKEYGLAVRSWEAGVLSRMADTNFHRLYVHAAAAACPHSWQEYGTSARSVIGLWSRSQAGQLPPVLVREDTATQDALRRVGEFQDSTKVLAILKGFTLTGGESTRDAAILDSLRRLPRPLSAEEQDRWWRENQEKLDPTWWPGKRKRGAGTRPVSPIRPAPRRVAHTWRQPPQPVYPHVDIRLRPDEIEIVGRIRTADPRRQVLVIEAQRANYPDGRHVEISPPRPKTALVDANTALHVRGRERLAFGHFAPGRFAIAIGRDLGTGKPLPARELALWARP